MCWQRSAQSCVCARARVLAERAVWAVLKSALRVQESPWPSASN